MIANCDRRLIRLLSTACGNKRWKYISTIQYYYFTPRLVWLFWKPISVVDKVDMKKKLGYQNEFRERNKEP